jgi:hypothetical protein
MSILSRRDFLKLAGMFSAGAALTGLRSSLPALPRGNSDKPNLLILLFDTMSAPHLSVNGFARPTTPNFERFARRATVYHSHYSAGNFTTPGTASMLTGLYPWNHRAFNLGALVRRNLTDGNLFRWLGADYYRFGFSQAIWADLLMRQFGADMDERLPQTTFSLKSQKPMVGEYFRGDSAIAYMAFEEYLFSVHQYINPVPGSPALGYLDLFYGKGVEKLGNPTADLPRGLPFNGFYFFDNAELYPGVEQTIARLHKQSSPFFGYFHLFSPHSPYCARKEFVGSMPELVVPFKEHHPLASHGKHQKLVEFSTQYDEYIATVDEDFGRLMDFLEAEGILDDTCVILTSDHGELFERGDSGHSSDLLFERIINIPLLISVPGQSQRRDIFANTSNTDLVPTLLSLAGQPIPPGLDGRLLPGFGGVEDPERPIISMEAKSSYAFQPLSPATLSMIKGDMKLIYYLGFEKYRDVFELYNLTNDREERKDLMPNPPSIAARLKEELLTMLDEADRPFQRQR